MTASQYSGGAIASRMTSSSVGFGEAGQTPDDALEYELDDPTPQKGRGKRRR